MVPPSTTPSNWSYCFCSCFSKSIHIAVCGGGQTHIKPWRFSALNPAITSHLTVSKAHGLALLFPELNSYPQSGPSGSHMACRFPPPPGDWGPSAQRFFLQCPKVSLSPSSGFKCSSWQHLDSPSRVKLQLFCHLTLPILLPVLFLSSASSNISHILLIHLIFSPHPPLPPQLQKVSSGQ